MDNIKRNHIIWMFDWCKEKFGKSKFNPDFTVKICRTKTDRYGCYYDLDNYIEICPNVHDSLLNLCDTVIHEYTHYLQNMVMYDNYFLKHKRNYDNHPYEIAADKKGKKFRKELRKAFKEEFGISKLR